MCTVILNEAYREKMSAAESIFMEPCRMNFNTGVIVFHALSDNLSACDARTRVVPPNLGPLLGAEFFCYLGNERRI